MGTFRIEIQAVGGHGVDRDVKNGEKVDFAKEGYHTPDFLAHQFADFLKARGCNVESAIIIHWPGDAGEVKDDLITGIRTGNF